MDTLSTHKVEVLRLGKIGKHPNADNLSITTIFSGYPCIIRTGDFRPGDLVAYVPPDSLVDTARPEFAFLAKDAKADGKARIRARKLRGIPSMGLLLPAPAGAIEGWDVATYFGVEHYEPPLRCHMGGEESPPPPGYRPGYDVDTLRRYADVFLPGELVWVTEKIHGTCARFCFSGGEVYAGSRRVWWKPNAANVWWQALAKHPEVEQFIRAHPDVTVYAEVYGQVQNLRYGISDGARIVVFDLLCDGRWLDPEPARIVGSGLPWVPWIGTFPFNLDEILARADGPSYMPYANHHREGIVVKPLHERTNQVIGRVQLKAVGQTYMEAR